MFSLNEWVLEGKVVGVTEKTRGYWVTVKGVAENPSLFSSDIYRIDCWITKRVLGSKQIKDHIRLKGRFRFKSNESFFITDTIL